MQYIVLERKVYERYSVVDADDPEKQKKFLEINHMRMMNQPLMWEPNILRQKF